MPKITSVRNKGSQQQQNLTAHPAHLISDVTKEENTSYLLEKVFLLKQCHKSTTPLEGTLLPPLGLTCLPIGKDTSIVAFKGILKNILSKALENNILTQKKPHTSQHYNTAGAFCPSIWIPGQLGKSCEGFPAVAKSHPGFAAWGGAEDVLQIFAAVKIRGWDYHGYTWMCLKQHPIKVPTQKFYQQRI